MSKSEQWQIYLPAVIASMLLMGAILFPLERRGYLRAVFLSQIALLVLVQAALWLMSTRVTNLWETGIVLFGFFCAFNMLEASQPSLVSRAANTSQRGTALGVYNTMQSLGLFAGGALGGWLMKLGGMPLLFAVCAVLLLLWLLLAWGMPSVNYGQARS